MIRNIIFDWSGTLVDDMPAVWRATNYVLQQAGQPEMSLDRFRAEFRLPFLGFYQEHVPHVPLPQLEAWFHGHFRQIQDTVVELPHAREFLGFCRQRGIRTIVLSTVHRDYYARQCERHGFGSFIEHAYLEVWDKRAKIGEILRTHGLAKAETLFIGDMQHDIETARHGGVRSCAVLTGYNRLDQLRASGPDLIVEHLGELRVLLERHGLELPSPSAEGAQPGRWPVATVGALIFNEAGEVLMVRTRKWSGLWGIPGGKIRYGEPSVQALHREIREETGLDIVDVRFELAQDCIDSPEFYRAAHFILLNYTCRSVGSPAVCLNDEAEEWRWSALDEAAGLPLNQPTRTLLEHVRQRT
jgi:phosphoglycolate phosphatase-like HAD superfamily hydrolase/ADP-ribose pyrophosphatase YjhB (NUDIX family)